jgi:hypothetical protein
VCWGPDWLYHHLTISGPAETVGGFTAAARGSGVIPWQLDFAAIKDDVFVRAASQPARDRNLTVTGCRILARQFRERVEARQGRAAALIGRSQACPFDLHALLPVPAAILGLGPTDPAALSWLAAHWGVTDEVRRVTLREHATTGRRLPRGHAVHPFSSSRAPTVAIDPHPNAEDCGPDAEHQERRDDVPVHGRRRRVRTTLQIQYGIVRPIPISGTASQ